MKPISEKKCNKTTLICHSNPASVGDVAANFLRIVKANAKRNGHFIPWRFCDYTWVTDSITK
jgi:hypothetical protein